MRDVRTTIVGNATGDPSILRGGTEPFTVLVRVAVNGRYFDSETGRFEDRRAEYFNVFLRRHLARHVLRSVHRGDPLIVTGRLGSSEWTTAEGQTKYSMTIEGEGIGHDLTFGASVYTKADAFETPDMDPRSGELLPPLETRSPAGGRSSGTMTSPAAREEAEAREADALVPEDEGDRVGGEPRELVAR